ncbi:unnamed protein product [Tuber aestivum]|uniref:Uncharacterized protein n=1 Tax=Tuber aestivum TaxID=59557 RepID=A0A292PUM8_9PEZI|nr:unnamed protein product [Tuber aestivum]
MTVTTTAPDKSTGTYQVVRETIDILFDYADTEVRSVHKSLAEANDAARKDLLTEYSVGELDECEEAIGIDGSVRINASTAEVDLTISVRHIPPHPHPHNYHHHHLSTTTTTEGENYVYTITRTDSSSTRHSTAFLGVYSSEDRANEAAERELRCAAGIRNWRDRRRFRGGFREGYGLNGCFEGAATLGKGEEGVSREEVTVVVERRVLYG